MSAKTMRLDIVSAQAAIFSGEVSFISVTGKVGELGIYPGHTPLLTSVKPGQVRATLAGGEENVFYMSGGMIEVQPGHATLLADTALRAEDIDEAAALNAQEQAEKIVSEQKSGLEYSQALADIAEASAQLQAIRMLKKHRR